MASVFKPKFKRWRDAKGRPCKRSTPGATFTKYEAEKWYGRYSDHDGIQRTIPLATDKSAAQTMLAEKIRESERRKVGLIDNFTDHAKEPIKVHLEAYRAYLQSTGDTADHIKETLNYCYMICEYRLPQNGMKKKGRAARPRRHNDKHKPVEAPRIFGRISWWRTSTISTSSEDRHAQSMPTCRRFSNSRAGA